MFEKITNKNKLQELELELQTKNKTIEELNKENLNLVNQIVELEIKQGIILDNELEEDIIPQELLLASISKIEQSNNTFKHTIILQLQDIINKL